MEKVDPRIHPPFNDEYPGAHKVPNRYGGAVGIDACLQSIRVVGKIPLNFLSNSYPIPTAIVRVITYGTKRTSLSSRTET